MKSRRWWDDFWYELKQEAHDALSMLMESSTWIMALALVAFGAEIYFGMQVALRYDTLMQTLGVRAATRCRILSNRQYMALIYTLFTFGIAVVYCLGRVVNYLNARRHKYPPKEIRRRGFFALLYGIAAESIGGVAITLLTVWC
jgi:hypothetical protein